MKYSGIPTWIVAIIIFVMQFVDGDKPADRKTIYFIAVMILAAISLTISTSKKIEK